MVKKRLFSVILCLMLGVVGCSNGAGNEEEVSSDKVETEETGVTVEEVTPPKDNSELADMDVMTEDEILAITGNEWTSFTDEDKFDAVSNFMYIMSEKNEWTFENTEMDYVNLIDQTYSDSTNLDKQFASIFTLIKTMEDNQ
jgi:translation elongation factor P/translation initiation factor 5A